ncbi:MAG: hypothetical protein ACTSXX_12465 [Candidatus Baldrarchaeia archaeon]
MITFTYGKTEIKIYGGYGFVGGNCVVIDSPSLKVMLDQGVNFSQLRKYYGFFIQPDSVEELRKMGVLPPREAYNEVEEVYITHLHLDHLGSLNVPKDIPTYLPSKDIAEILSRSWWFGWKQHLIPKTQSFYGFREIKDADRILSRIVSHSAYPSYTLRVDTDDASIIYTGDLRIRSLHPISGDTLENIRAIAEDGADILIIEGTNFGRRMNYLSPSHFEAMFTDVLNRYDGDVLFLTVHPLDLEATLSALRIIWRCDYTPVFESPYYAKLFDMMLNTTKYTLSNEVFFTPRTSKMEHFDNIEIAFLGELRDRKLAILIPPHEIKDMENILNALRKRGEGIIHITILGEPLSEEWIIEWKKIENWFKIFGITSYQIHVSGHYHPYEFKEIIKTVKPKKLIPIHTRAPNTMLALFDKLQTH